MVTTHNQPNWVQPRYVYVSRWRRKSRSHHHTRWCSARKLYIPWPWCVWSVCCSLWMTKHRGCYFFYSVVQLNIAESETFSSSRANGWRIMNNLKLLVKYFDARWTGDILSSYLCFLSVIQLKVIVYKAIFLSGSVQDYLACSRFKGTVFFWEGPSAYLIPST